MNKYNISTNLIRVTKNRCNKAISAVLLNSSIGDWFRTTAGVRQSRHTLTQPLQHIYGKDHDRRLRRSRRHSQFCDINGFAGVEEELAKVVERLDKVSTAYGMEISAKKIELMQITPAASTLRS